MAIFWPGVRTVLGPYKVFSEGPDGDASETDPIQRREGNRKSRVLVYLRGFRLAGGG